MRKSIIKTLSVLMSITILFSSSSLAFANNINIVPNQNIDNDISYNIVNNIVVPMGNWDSRFKTVYKRTMINHYSKYFTFTEAEKNRTFNNIAAGVASTLLSLTLAPLGNVGSAISGLFLAILLSNFSSVGDLEGNYVVTVNQISEYKKNILNGKESLNRQGYEIIIVHNGRSGSKILWK